MNGALLVLLAFVLVLIWIAWIERQAIGIWLLSRLYPELPMSFQSRVAAWLIEAFGTQAAFDVVERGDRLVEEVFELLQA